MFEIRIHKDAEKALKKSQNKIKKKAFKCIQHFMNHGIKNIPYPIKMLKGHFKKFKYFEIKIDKDYRIVFRFDKNTFYIRYAGTHNALGTG